MTQRTRPGAPLNASLDTRYLLQVARAVNRIMNGQTNNVGEFTLTAGTTQTTVTDSRASIQGEIILTPKTANAAGGLATTYIPTANKGNGTFTVNHTSAATTDRTFGYCLIG